MYADPDPQNLVSADPDADLTGSESLTIKIKSPNFSKNIYSLISKSKILLIFKSEPKECGSESDDLNKVNQIFQNL